MKAQDLLFLQGYPFYIHNEKTKQKEQIVKFKGNCWMSCMYLMQKEMNTFVSSLLKTNRSGMLNIIISDLIDWMDDKNGHKNR